MATYIFRCTECGGTDIQIRCWVNPNTDDIIDECENPTRECWCEDCKEHTEYECITIDE